MLRSARWLTFGSAASILFSIAISQILMGLAAAALLASGQRLRCPRIKWPLGLFLLGTAISVAFAAEPAAGLPQIRKFYVFLILPLLYSALPDLKTVRRLFLAWGGIAALTALRGFAQFAAKAQEARALGRGFYDYYVADRITGFTSHWNTYSGEEMLALIMLAALLLFGPRARRTWFWALCGCLIALAVLLADTRGLGWRRRRRASISPVLLEAMGSRAGPRGHPGRLCGLARAFARAVHLDRPQPRKIDSNEFRKVVWRTGLAIVRKHPLLGPGTGRSGQAVPGLRPRRVFRAPCPRATTATCTASTFITRPSAASPPCSCSSGC